LTAYFGVCQGCLGPMVEDGWKCDWPYPGAGPLPFETCGKGPFCPNCHGDHLESEHGWDPQSCVVEAPPDPDEEEP
jgi:hypothetical protein